jgi:hypothetical protein
MSQKRLSLGQGHLNLTNRHKKEESSSGHLSLWPQLPHPKLFNRQGILEIEQVGQGQEVDIFLVINVENKW